MLAEFLRRMTEARVATLPEGEREAAMAAHIATWNGYIDEWRKTLPEGQDAEPTMVVAPPERVTLAPDDPRVQLFMAHCFAEHLAGHAGATFTEALTRFGALDWEVQRLVHTPEGWKQLAKLLTRPGTPPLPVTIH